MYRNVEKINWRDRRHWKFLSRHDALYCACLNSIAFIISLFLISQGTPQTLKGNLVVETMSGVKQTIAYGPIASLEAIKHLGTNGGGFLGANSSTPFENPTYWSNFAEALSMMLIPGSLVFLFGRMLKTKKQIHPHALMIFIAMFTLFIAFYSFAYTLNLQVIPYYII